MATKKITKKITKKGNYDFIIDENFQNTVYSVSNNSIANDVSFNFTSTQELKNYTFEKQNNNLILYCFFAEKFVTVTISNFYKYYTNNNNLLSFNNIAISPEYIESYISSIDLAGSLYQNTSLKTVVNQKGANYYNLTSINNESNEIYDIAGNDTYNVWNGNSGWIFDDENFEPAAYIYDYAGNDIYKIHEKSTVAINDIKGNDKYDFLNGSYSVINDYAGNDTYKMSCIYGTTINDYKGNDVYNSYGAVYGDISNIYHKTYINDSAGNDTYNIVQNWQNVFINDYAGNDKYNFNSSFNHIEVDDKKGNDIYKIIGGIGQIFLTDRLGNDKYDIQGGYWITITDNAGNDNYNIQTINYKLSITDEKGNDKYTISCVDDELTITDNSGNDMYNISSSTDLIIEDKEGKDTYNIFDNRDYVKITDGAESSTKSGNDTYNLSYLQNAAGNTYTMGGVIKNGENVITDYYGNEKYNVSCCYRLQINDKQGKDTYTINDSSEVKIIDGVIDAIDSGNDTYKISNTTSLSVCDYIGNDVYALSNVFKQNNNNVITDYDGTDTYNITSSNISIIDKGEDNDTYIIKNLSSIVKINDDGGNDKLTITSLNKNNAIFMANYDLSTTGINSDISNGSLFIFDKTMSGFIEIENFFSTEIISDNEYINTADFKGNGYIENIYAGKVKENSVIANYANNIDALGQEVATWLSSTTLDNSYDSVAAILNSDSLSDISKFMTFIAQS